MKIFKEFRDFAMRGNVVDLAVGVVIGGAFGKITTSLVNDVIMPPIGLLMSGVDFKELSLTIKAAGVNAAGAATDAVVIKYGAFINTLIDFTIVAAALFILIKAMNTLKRKQEAAPPTPATTPADVMLLTEIRDLLKKQP